MQEKEDLTKQIMAEVAQDEERRLGAIVKKAGPFIVVGLIAGGVGLGRVTLNLMGKGVLDLLRAITMQEIDTDVFTVIQIFWEETEKGAVVVMVAGAITAMVVIALTGVWRWPRRWRDIKRYRQK